MLKVFYSKPTEQIAYDPGFGQVVKWDIPLLEGYEYAFQSAGSRAKNRNLIQAIENWQPDALLVFGWNPPGHLRAMQYFKGRIPVWFRGDSNLVDEKPGLRKWARRLFLHWVYSFVDHAFYVGANNRNYYLTHGLHEEQLSFAPHAIDNERFFDTPEKRYEEKATAWRREMRIEKDSFVVLFAGKLEPKKGPGFLLKAVQEINQANTDSIKLIFIGSGSLEEKLQGRAKDDSNIFFLGFQNQSVMPVAYRLGNVFCLPSKGPGETWGLAVNEALACGRPVVVSDKVGCAADLVNQPFLGSTFESQNLSGLIKSLLKVQDQNQIEDARRSKFISSWSFEKIAGSLEDRLLE